MLARQLQTKVEGMLKDYQESGEAKEKDFTEELTTRVSRQIVDTTLVGTATKLAHLSTNGVEYADYGTAFAAEWHQIFFYDPEGNIIEVHQQVV